MRTRNLVEDLDVKLRILASSYVTSDEILLIFDKIASQLDFAEKVTHRRQSVLTTSYNILNLMPPYPLQYYNSEVQQLYSMKYFLEYKVK